MNVLDYSILYNYCLEQYQPALSEKKKNKKELRFCWFSSDDFIILVSDEIISVHGLVDFLYNFWETNQKKYRAV